MDAFRFATTKIQPPRPRAVRVERPSLDRALAAALKDRRVVLLQAPAGFAKTSALATQLACWPPGWALAWVSLDEDDDPQRLFACLAAALEPFDLPWRTAPEALVAQMGDDGPGLKRAIAELQNALAGAEAAHGVIVLDDLHRVALKETHAFLDALIERLPSQWTVALASRVEPPLALARLRVADELVEFLQHELRFSAEEAAALAAADEPPLSPERIEELFERTQGWPAGLRLCIAALRARPALASGLAAARKGPVDRHLFEYLASEVLDEMPPPLHDFLVRCSVLPALTAARAAAVSGDARAADRLDEIERRGLFVTTLEAHERTLVLHDLFRDALEERLRQRMPDEMPDLLRRAAAGETEPLRRVGYLLRAGDSAAAEEVLAQAAPELFVQGGAGEMQRAIAQFPAAWRDGSARLLRLSGIACCLRWRWNEMARSLESAIAVARQRGDEAERRLCEAYLAAALYPIGRNEEAERLLAALDAEPLPADARLVLQISQCSQHFRRGEHDRVPAVYRQVLDALERTPSLYVWWESAPVTSWNTLRGMRPLFERYFAGALRRCGERALPMRAQIRVQQAFAHWWGGEVERALDELRLAESDMKWLACSADTEIAARLFQVITGAAQGRAEEVTRTLDSLHTLEDQNPDVERRRLWHHHLATYGVRAADVLGGDPAMLRRWAGELLERPLDSPGPVSPRGQVVRARLAAAEQRWADAAALLGEVQPQFCRMETMAQAIELQLRLGHALLRCGRIEAAAEALRPALERMRGEGERGHALMCGPVVLAALDAARWGPLLDAACREELHAATALAQRVRHGAPVQAAAAEREAPGDALLTEREREVLERVAAGDSNKLIARALEISPHTVKRHVANILDKLGLASRGQASAWLREHVA